MNLMNKLTVRGKLTFAFACVLLVMAALGGLSILQLARGFDRTESLSVYRLPGVRDSLRMVSAATRFRLREYRAFVSTADEMDAAEKRLDDARGSFEAARKDYAEFIADDAERKLYQQAMGQWKSVEQAAAQLVPLMRAGKTAEARELVLGAKELKRFDEALAAIQALADYNDAEAKKDAASARTIFERSRIAVGLSVMLGLLVSVGLGWLIHRAISTPLRMAVTLAESVAAGDLATTPTADGKDEVAALTRALGHMVTQLRSVVSEVRGGVESVSTASAQIATGNLDLSQRTEEQASNLQQTAASMEQLTSTVRHNADNAREASNLARGASDVAERGGRAVGEVVATMQAISDSSRRIADIIGVIDGIAFQTNILALNAAVEAARAGEQGRGFAVVATEVRTLAQRSAQAAREIKALIEQSTHKVDDGARQVAEAGQTMADIVRQVKNVNDLIGEISSASHEQSRGIEQVGQAVSQLDQVTQQNAALVEESAAAAESMKHQAIKLAQTVAVFKLGTAAS